ncbi:MAG: hypothetical protein JO032_20240 [Alphaproteobacteria bacterium]|nr:hypothetical protein [Alphaproteobacteria bacterium]
MEETPDRAVQHDTTKTVLEMDLVAYSDVARMIEENLDVVAVKTFEDQVQSFVDTGLAAVGLSRDEAVLGTAGDNAILLFDDPAVMHGFAEAVQNSTLHYNETKTTALAKRWFRMGAATGIVLMIPEKRRIVGSTIARAVRLESAANKGQLLVDPATYEALPDELKRLYGDEEVVKGKRQERFHARRCTLVPLGGEDEAAAGGHEDAAKGAEAPLRRRLLKPAAAGAALAMVAAGLLLLLGQPFAHRSVTGPPTWEARLDATKVTYPNESGEQIWIRAVVLASQDARPLDTAIFAPFDNFGEIKRFSLTGRRLSDADFAPWLDRWRAEAVSGRSVSELSQRFDGMVDALQASGDAIGKVTRTARADGKWDEAVVGIGLSIVANGTTPHIGPLDNPIGQTALLFVLIQIDCIPGSHPDMAGLDEDWLGHRFSWPTQTSLAIVDSTHGRPIDITSLRTIYRTAAGPVDVATRGVTRLSDRRGIFLHIDRSEPNDYDRLTWAWAK